MAAIALRNLASRKLRTVLTSLAIVLGVMMVAGTYVLTDTIDRSFDEIFTESNKGIDAVVITREAIEADDGQTPPFEDSILRRVLRTDGVASAAGGIFDPQVAIIDSDGERIGGDAPTFGASDPPEPFDPFTYEAGREPANAGEVVIDRHTAERASFEIGDRIEVAGREAARSYELVGIATLGEVDSFGGASIAIFTLAEAQRITGKRGQFDQINIEATDGVSPQRLVANLDRALPRSVEAQTAEENVQSQRDDVGTFIGFLKTILLVFAGVALFVAAFLIFNTFSITVAQRTREFAMLRTLGANRRQIVTSVIVEALVIGTIGSVAGMLAGIGFAPVIESLFRALEIDLPNTGTVIRMRTIVVALVLGIGLTVLSALVPALRATRVPPVQGLREGAVLATPRERRLRAAGGVMLAGAGIGVMLLALFGFFDQAAAWLGVGAVAVFLGVALLSPRLVGPLASAIGHPLERFRGVPGRLARENAVRNPGRTASTAAALMIGLALVSFVSVFAAGLRSSIDQAIDKTIRGDLFLANSDNFSDIPLAAGEAVTPIDGVEIVSPLRYTQHRFMGGGSGYMSLIDPTTAAAVLKLDWDDGSEQDLAALGATEAIADAKWADGHGLEVGDTFETITATGRAITYTIRATINDDADFAGDFYASDVNAADYGEAGNATNILVKLAEGADAAAVQAEIDGVLTEKFPVVEAQSQQQLKDSIASEINGLLSVVYALLGLAVVVSLFGIVNTLALTIHERTRELGLLRAVGMSQRQVRRIVRYESVITAMIGALLGALLGIVFAVIVSRPLADEGFSLSFPIATLVTMQVLAVLAGVLAAIGPARRASRLDVLEALAYE